MSIKLKSEKTSKGRNYHEWLIGSLKVKKEAESYLNSAWEEGSKKYFLKALRNVVEAQGGMSKVAIRAKVTREGLYQMLSEKGNPEWESINRIFHAVGIKPVFHFEQIGTNR